MEQNENTLSVLKIAPGQHPQQVEMLLYSVMQFLWSGQFDMNRVLALTGIIAVVFLLRILIYSYGYTKAQIGGAEVSKNIRLFMGDHQQKHPRASTPAYYRRKSLSESIH